MADSRQGTVKDARIVSSASYSHCRENARTHRVATRRFSLRRRFCRCGGLLVAAALLATAPWAGASSLLNAQDSEAAEGTREQSEGHKEYTLKAVFLYSFGRYVEWPKTSFTTAKAPFVIGILGEDSFGGALDEIAKKRTLQGRTIVIKRFATPGAYKPPCHILFVSRSLTAEQHASVIAKTSSKPVFVVGETPGFAERGGTANFGADGDRIAIEINIDSARHARFRVDARLLKLAKRVGGPPTTANN
jgi:hypothetical protein